ncbi:MAG: amino acid--tRNA ligase-related protein [Candidatus Babeliaceae bacterium]
MTKSMLDSVQTADSLVYYDRAITQLRTFFKERNFIEVATQQRLSILAACEDPFTIAPFDYVNQRWPLPQTGQMWLECDLLKNPHFEGLFCITTSYRAEPNPIPGRHQLIFPMVDFETHGDVTVLQALEKDLLEYMGFGHQDLFSAGPYETVAQQYGIKDIDHACEEKIGQKYGPVFFLTHFPEYTHPFWNMKRVNQKAQKIDVLLYGMETIGSAERSTDKNQMRELFYTIKDGKYVQKLYEHFGKQRVDQELEEFLSFDFFPRCGGGIGITRMIRALRLLDDAQYQPARYYEEQKTV